MHRPCCDRYHCHPHNIRHHAECACLGYALRKQFTKLEITSRKQISRFQKLCILQYYTSGDNYLRNLTHDARVHQGSAHLHQNLEYKNQVEPAIDMKLTLVNS